MTGLQINSIYLNSNLFSVSGRFYVTWGWFLHRRKFAVNISDSFCGKYSKPLGLGSLFCIIKEEGAYAVYHSFKHAIVMIKDFNCSRGC